MKCLELGQLTNIITGHSQPRAHLLTVIRVHHLSAENFPNLGDLSEMSWRRLRYYDNWTEFPRHDFVQQADFRDEVYILSPFSISLFNLEKKCCVIAENAK